MQIDLTITQEQAQTRLDMIVSSVVEVCSRKTAARCISDGQIRVNGSHKKPAYKVQTNDLITGTIEIREPVLQPTAEKISLDIIHEDDHIIVINKRAGMVVHPASGHEAGTLVNALIYHCPDIKDVGGVDFRAGIVHRLDKDTSGIMVTAKTLRSLEFLQKEFRMRRVEKTYLALVDGPGLNDEGEIDLPIGRHPVKRKQMSVNRQTGKKAITRWKVVHRFPNACMVEVSLLTGRTHQIRVHFYEMGHPLIGDPVYQFRRQRRLNKNDRQMLHARNLSFRHPYSGRRVSFHADPPDDFIQRTAKFQKQS